MRLAGVARTKARFSTGVSSSLGLSISIASSSGVAMAKPAADAALFSLSILLIAAALDGILRLRC
jgi:hypothetical protein